MLILLAFFIAISSNIEILAANDALIKQKKIYNTGLMYSYNVANPCQSSSTIGDNKDYAGNPILNEAQLEAVKANQPFYEKAVEKYGNGKVEWQTLAAIHYREHGFSRDNPNGDGPYQWFSSSWSGGYLTWASSQGHTGNMSAGDVSDDEFQWQTNYLAHRVAESLKDDNSEDAIKRFFFAYNGQASVYKQQALGLGFDQAGADRGEGSPYVMNRADAKRDPTAGAGAPTWGQIKTDGGNLSYPANNDYGAFVVYKGLGGGSSSSSSSSESSGGRPTKVFLDPGHTGGPSTAAAAETTGPAAGLINNDYSNGQEDKDVWYVATEVEKRLEEDGYEVIMSRSESEASSLTAKGNKANEAKADIGVSIHTSQGLAGYGVGYDVVGNFRQNTSDGKRITFDNGDVASKSAEYSKKIASARTEAEGREVVASGDMSGSFPQGRGLPSWGNTAVIMLAAQDVPWAYNEFDRAGSALTGQEKQQYIDGLYNGIKDAVPATMNGSECEDTGAGSGDVLEAAKALAWPEPGHGNQNSGATPEQAAAFEKAFGRKAGNVSGDELTDCCKFVATVVHHAGIIKDGEAAAFRDKLLWNSQGWPGFTEIESRDTSEVQPGDIVTSDEHCWIRGEDVNGQPTTIDASLRGHVAEIKKGFSLSGGDIHIWRYTGGSN